MITVKIKHLVDLFATEWERSQGYKPAPFQKAIAMQRIERGQSIREIVDALVAMRVSSLYILRPGDVPDGQSADSYYSRGIAVCK